MSITLFANTFFTSVIASFLVNKIFSNSIKLIFNKLIVEKQIAQAFALFFNNFGLLCSALRNAQTGTGIILKGKDLIL